MMKTRTELEKELNEVYLELTKTRSTVRKCRKDIHFKQMCLRASVLAMICLVAIIGFQQVRIAANGAQFEEAIITINRNCDREIALLQEELATYEEVKIEQPLQEEISEENANSSDLSAFTDVPLDEELKAYIYTSAIANDIPAEILFAIANKESKFNPLAKGNNGDSIDYGMFQMNDSYHDYYTEKSGIIINETTLMDPYLACDAACWYLNFLIKNYDNSSWHHVLMQYNLGPGNAEKCFLEGKYSSEYSRAVEQIALGYGLKSMDL